MNLLQLSFAYLKRRPLNTVLNILLLSLGIATIVVLLLFSHQVEDNLYKNAEGVDAVVGAKGSPVQLILSSIFHIDAPTGNIELHEAKELMRHRAVADAIPLALGDNFRGYRIVGTTSQYIDKYGGELSKGTLWDHEFEVVMGSTVAEHENLSIGDSFVSSHGFSGGGHAHDDHDLYVVGILQPTGTVLDRLILTGVETMWGIHEPHDDEDHNHGDEDHDHDHDRDSDHNDDHGHEVLTANLNGQSDSNPNSQHDHPNNSGQNHTHESGAEGDHHTHHDHTRGRDITDKSYLKEENSGEQITSLLIRYSNPLAAAQFPRFVNAETNMQAAAPAVEITRLIGLLGVGFDAIEIFAYILIFASILGIFIAMINSMKERKYDLAIMRTLGGSRQKLFMHVVLEGVIVSVAGALLGIVMGHLAVEGIGMMMSEARQFNISGKIFILSELWIFVLALAVGMVAALIPAIKAYNTQIAETLSKT